MDSAHIQPLGPSEEEPQQPAPPLCLLPPSHWALGGGGLPGQLAGWVRAELAPAHPPQSWALTRKTGGA